MPVKTINTNQPLKRIHIAMLGFFLGVLSFAAYRFVTYSSEPTHFHANFAVYTNGEKQQFEESSYYEELAECAIDATPMARDRAHMHEPENGLVHIHDEAVTWGNYFENLGYSVGANHLATNTQVYSTSDTSVIYALNGKKLLGNPAEKEISSQDRLLVVIGATSDAEALEFFDSVVPGNAAKFNESDDPGSCSSNEGHRFTDRLKGVF